MNDGAATMERYPIVVDRSTNWFGVVLMIVCLLSLAINGWLGWKVISLEDQPTVVESSATKAEPVVKAPAIKAPLVSVTKAPMLTEQLKLSVVGKHGQEAVFARQLENNPSLADGQKADGVSIEFKGDLGDKIAVHLWAGRAAHLIAIGAGYIDVKFGAEMRVWDQHTAFHLQKAGGKLQVAEYSNAAGSNPQLQTTRDVMSSPVPPSHFLGWPPAHHKVPWYLHRYPV